MLKIIKPAIILLIICGLTTAALAYVNLQTADKIAEQIELAQTEARKQVLPKADSFKEVENLNKIIGNHPELKTIKNAHLAYKGDVIVGYTCLVTSKGYGGDVNIIIGIDIEGKVQGTNIVEHNETPGLGTKASDEEFKSQLINVNIKNEINLIKSKKIEENDVEAIAGATITSRAVVNATTDAGKLFSIIIEGGN